ncbi:MAG: hypothetical protein R3D55_23920 [Chloroflexota bacterium]
MQTSTAVFDLFSHLIDQGKTLLMVTHDKTLASQAQRVVEIRIWPYRPGHSPATHR